MTASRFPRAAGPARAAASSGGLGAGAATPLTTPAALPAVSVELMPAMLPRITASVPLLARGSLPRPTYASVLRARAAVAAPAPALALALAHAHASPPTRAFHASRPAPDAPRSPFAVFVDTLKDELRKNKDLQDNVRQLQGEAGKVQDSAALQQAKAAYERMRIVSSLKENPKLQAAAAQLKQSGGKVGDAVGEALKQLEESELARALGAVGRGIANVADKTTAPVRNTDAYRNFSSTLAEAFDDGGSALRMYDDQAEANDARHARAARRAARLKRIGRQPPVHDVEADPTPSVDPELAARAEAMGISPEMIQKSAEADQAAVEEAERAAGAPKRLAGYAVTSRVLENPDAGEALVLTAEKESTGGKLRNVISDSFVGRKWSEFKEVYAESEAPAVERLRSVTDRIGGWFEENETAQVVRALRMQEPGFSLARFNVELREYVLPEFIDAYHAGSRLLLRQWCGEATYNVIMATVEPYLAKGYIPHGRLLDLDSIEVLSGKMLDGGLPVVVVTCATQELMYFTDPRTGEVKAGNKDQAEACRYALVLTRDESMLDNEITGGWKIIEVRTSSRLSCIPQLII